MSTHAQYYVITTIAEHVLQYINMSYFGGYSWTKC